MAYLKTKQKLVAIRFCNEPNCQLVHLLFKTVGLFDNYIQLTDILSTKQNIMNIKVRTPNYI